MDTPRFLAFCEAARIGYLCVRRKCIASAATITEESTYDQRKLPCVTRFRRILSDSQRSKIKRVLGALIDLTAYDAVIVPD